MWQVLANVAGYPRGIRFADSCWHGGLLSRNSFRWWLLTWRFFAMKSSWWHHPHENLCWRDLSFHERFTSRSLMMWHYFLWRSLLMTAFLWKHVADVILVKSTADVARHFTKHLFLKNYWHAARCHSREFWLLTSSSLILVADVIVTNFGSWCHRRNSCHPREFWLLPSFSRNSSCQHAPSL